MSITTQYDTKIDNVLDQWIGSSFAPSPMRTFVHWHTCSTDWLYHMLHTIAKEYNNYSASEFVVWSISLSSIYWKSWICKLSTPLKSAAGHSVWWSDNTTADCSWLNQLDLTWFATSQSWSWNIVSCAATWILNKLSSLRMLPWAVQSLIAW